MDSFTDSETFLIVITLLLVLISFDVSTIKHELRKKGKDDTQPKDFL